jgi:hypothetical protein
MSAGTSTESQLTQLSNGNVNGTTFGQSTTDKISFYGVTPVVQGAAVTTLATTPTATDIATAVNSIITRLQSIGVIA